ncbi:chitin binding [Dermatophagoides pteronyssinus]|uniref:Chitin binding n=1 Tax=Dermatophagoides pteronyssinus TaxID=6956 RepID=A0ABQ8J064_DERPT|nr:chitin binding [Dermatophagoides pteronyssinus]
MTFHNHQHNQNPQNKPSDLFNGARPVMSAPKRSNTNSAIVLQRQFISTPLLTNPTSTLTTTTKMATTKSTTPAPISITSFSRTAINNNNDHRHPLPNYDYDLYDDHFYNNYGVTSSHTFVSTTTTRAPSRRQMTNKLRTSSSSNLKNSQTKMVMTKERSGKTNAERCTEQQCHLPYCRCGSSTIPDGLKSKDIAQLVMITFDDSINELNWELYQEIFSNRFNPNGCPILGTFYVSHEWTDYSQVQNLYSIGHEMASHTITHSFGDKFSKEKWLNEVNGQREILSLYGGVKYEDVRGMRAPFLQPGGNRQYEMLYDANFTYDSSLPVFENNPPYWPYTFDYAMSHDCMITPCPSKSFPGLWEVGMVMLIDHRGGRCSMVDACSHPSTEDGVFENLLKNFNRHYHSNKAPFGLYFHSAWFNTAHHKNGFLRFIDHILKNKDVYFVTKWQLLQWMMQPTPLSRLKSFQPFQCDYSDRPACNRPKICSTSHRDGPRYLKTCQKCPKQYPWVGKTGFKK